MNYGHLHYFWVAAKAGGIMRAAEQLHTAPQTLSTQIKLLEEHLGQKLFRRSGRHLALTEMGSVVLGYADGIFALGAELEGAARQARSGPRTLDFRVGVTDSVTKAVAYRLLEPALDVAEPVRLICGEGKLPDLLSQLALNRIDLVIADEPMPRRVSVKAFNHALGSSAMTFFCAPKLKPLLKQPFPQCLNNAPMLLQAASTAIRQQFDNWLSRHGIHPRVIAEFEDGALMKAFGREGRGVFMAPTVLEAEIQAQYGVKVVGRSDDLVEEFYAISVERRITHPCVAAISQAARGRLFGA